MKKIFRYTTGCFLLLILLTACNGQSGSGNQNDQNRTTGPTTKADKIDQLLSDYAAYSKFNGAVLVAEEGEIIYKKGFGWANVEWDMPNQTDTKFRIASITKQFTAMLILQLVNDGKLDLHKPISTYLSNYPKKNADIITLHHLLTHTAGIAEFDEFVTYRNIERDRYKPGELVDIFAEGKLQFQPGSQFAYSNPGYVVLGVIIETVTGKSYGEVLQEKIFDPLQMANSGYDVNTTVLKKRASGYTPNYGRGNFVNVNFTDMSIPYAAGSIYSTVDDLYLWDQALYTEKLLPDTSKELYFGKHISAYNGRHYAYGWVIGGIQIGNTEERAQTIGHSGGINGFRSQITRIPDSKSSVILLSNLERVPLFELTVAINGILHDTTYNKNKSVAFILAERIKKQGISRALDYFKELRASKDYYLDPDEMNMSGYELLELDRPTDAEFIFKLNLEIFPEIWWVYDSYGEILLELGRKKQAIENYRKSVELNPDHKNGFKILEELEQGVERP